MRVLRQMVIATIVTLAVIEIGLQLASLVAPSVFGRAGQSSDSDTITILCVGDSHTYGAPLPEADAYPAQLQRMLDEKLPQWSFEVINLGFPGVNSTFVANRLEAQLDQIQPDIVMVSAGANNLWNKLGEDEENQGTSAFRQALLKIKLYRLLTIASAVHEKERYGEAEGQGRRWFTDERREDDAVKIVEEYHRKVDGKVDKQYLGVLSGDMKRIKRMTDEIGAPLIWFNYPWRHEGAVMKAIDRLGAKHKIAVVRGELDFKRAHADGREFNDLFVWAMGAHPNTLMYYYVVESMVPYVEAAVLESRGRQRDGRKADGA